jgi:hypothetical protein
MSTISDGFDLISLCHAINQGVDRVPGIIDLFHEEPINSTKVKVELIEDNVTLIQSSPRGAPPPGHQDAKRKLIEFSVPHIKTQHTLMAATWQDRRGWGSANPSEPHAERDRILRDMRGRVDATIDYHRSCALNGLIKDADGSTLVDLFAAFDLTQQTVDFDLDNTATDVVTKVLVGKRLSQAAVGRHVRKWVGYASPGFLDAMRVHGSVQKALANWSAASSMRDDTRDGFDVGSVTWIEVAPLNGVTYIPTDTAFLCPVDVPGLYTTWFAPSDYVESVNAEGARYYARAEDLPMGRGWDLEAQSNPISIISKPRAVIKCTA